MILPYIKLKSLILIELIKKKGVNKIEGINKAGDFMEILWELFQKYGWLAVIIVLVVILTQIVKKLFLNKMVAEVEKNGFDKSLITKNFMYVPYIISFILSSLYQLIVLKFNFVNFNIHKVISDTVIIAFASIGLYEQIKLQLEAYKIKKTLQQNDDKSD